MSRFFLLILLYVGLAAAWAWRLKPAPAYVEDPQRQPRLERLTVFLTKAPPVVLERILMSIAPIPDERLALVDAWLKLPPMEQLRELTVRDPAMLKGAGTLRDSLLLGWLGHEKRAIAPHEAHLMIAASGSRLDDQMRLYAFETLAARARRDGDLDGAISILDRAADIPRAKWAVTRTLVQIARERDQSMVALGAINDWLKKVGDKAPAADLDEAREMQVHLMLRLNRPADALDLQLARLEQVPAEAPLPEATLNRALVCARAAQQELKMISWLERQLATFPEHKLKPEELQTRAEVNSEYLHWLKEHASIVDRELPAVRGFEACLRLAAAGERTAISRFCALAEGAKGGEAAVKLLRQLLQQPLLRSAVLELAQQQPLARRAVAEALRAASSDRELHFAATLAEAAAAPGSAPALWQGYLRRFPADAAAQRRLIQAHLAARQPSLALRVFDSMDEQKLTEADRRQRELLGQL